MFPGIWGTQRLVPDSHLVKSKGERLAGAIYDGEQRENTVLLGFREATCQVTCGLNGCCRGEPG